MKQLRYGLLAFVLIACADDREKVDDPDLIPVQILGLFKHEAGGVAVYLKGSEPRVVPIVIGHFEARALQMAIRQKESFRPLPYDLLQEVLEQAQGDIRQLVIHSLRKNVFYAHMVVEVQGDAFLLDCRPSDGMVMATRLGVPIYMTPEVLDRAGTELEKTVEIGGRLEPGHPGRLSLI